jgi:hypothetical protein
MAESPSSSSSSDGPDPIWRTDLPRIESLVELRAFLGERDDMTSLAELADGDRLGMLPRAEIWMNKNAQLLDYPGLVYDALTMVVAAGPTIDGSEDMDAWLEGTIDIAARGLLDRDIEFAKAGTPVEEPFEVRFAFLMESLRFNPGNVRLATVAANGLPEEERQVFYHCFVLGKGFGRYEQEVGVDAFRARDLLMRAIDKLSDAVGDL